MLIGQHLVENSIETAESTLREWQSAHPELGLLVLLPEAEAATLPRIQSFIRQLGIPFIGAIFPALLTDAGFSSHGISLLGFKRMPAFFLLTELQREGGEKLGQATLELLKTRQMADSTPTLFLIFDGMLPNIGSMLNELHNIIGPAANCSGVNAGSESFQHMPCLFDDQRVIGNGVLGLLLEDQPGIAVKHGYPVSKSLMNATSTAGNRINTLNNRPAFEVYQEVIQAEYGVTLTRDNFYDHAVHFPFGLVTVLDVLVRIPVAFTDDGALFCVGEVPPNTMLKLLRAPELEKSSCTHELSEALESARESSTGHTLLTFYCAGRRMHFGDKAVEELGDLRTRTGASRFFGALTLGEIDSIEELNLLPRFHNAAMVCIRF